MRRRPHLVMLAVLAMLVAPSAPPASASQLVRSRVLMGTIATVSAPSRDSLRTGEAVESALDGIARLERVMSDWDPDSEVARVNRRAGTSAAACSPDLFAVLDSAAALARLSEGAYDPSVEPLLVLWDVRGRGRVPDAGALTRVQPLVDHSQLVLDPVARTVRFGRTGMAVNLGGIGKGFALDRAGDALRDAGITEARLDLGGQWLVLGPVCTLAVAHPADRLRGVVRIPVQDASVSTSSQGEHRIHVGSRSFGHILDPRRGSPVPYDASVTVVCASATRADALSTALLVMGRARAASFAQSHPELGVLWLEPEGTGVQAWRWNLPGSDTAPGAQVHWNITP